MTVYIDSTGPTVDAGSDRSAAEGESVTLTGTFDDGTGYGPYSLAWHLVSSSNGQMVDDVSGDTLTFTPVDDGTYVFSYTVTDVAGNATTDSVSVTATNVAPSPAIVSISEPRVEGTAIAVTATATDPAGANDTLTYTWTVLKDHEAYDSASGVDMTEYTFTPDDDATYTINLTVSDEDGGSTTVGSTIDVANVLPAPQIVSISEPQVERTAITVTGSATDPAGANDTLTYSWQVFKGAETAAFATDSGVDVTSFSFTPDDNASYRVVLTVTDDSGTTVAPSVRMEFGATEIHSENSSAIVGGWMQVGQVADGTDRTDVGGVSEAAFEFGRLSAMQQRPTCHRSAVTWPSSAWRWMARSLRWWGTRSRTRERGGSWRTVTGTTRADTWKKARSSWQPSMSRIGAPPA